MSPFSVTILGCSSATPTNDRHPSSQIVNINDQLLMIDCGEGTQTQIFRYGIRLGRIDYILISHLHGDHFLGLPGLLSTMSLNGRTLPLHLVGPAPLKAFLENFFKISDTVIRYEIIYTITHPDQDEWVLDQQHFRIRSFPLKHRVPCNGFIIQEKRQPRKINVEACEQYKIPVEYFAGLKLGHDYEPEQGSVIPNAVLTIDPPSIRNYAYCSDTIYDETLCEYIKGVDLLYHEATFQNDRKDRARETFHSTAAEAASIASKAQVKKLLIGHFSARYHDLNGHLKEANWHFANTALALEGEIFQVI